MLIIGLTGSIGMGKTTAAKRFRSNGIAVFDADAEVHRLYEGEIVSLLSKAFPEILANGAIDRSKLSKAILANPLLFKKLEEIVHPKVKEAIYEFLQEQGRAGAKYAVLEIPLLFETGAVDGVDVTVVVSAPEDVQRKRVMSRSGMSDEKFAAILARQMPDEEKRRLADFVVDTSGSIEHAQEQVDNILRQLSGQEGKSLKLWDPNG
jgi:dephospho-CoA kinase